MEEGGSTGEMGGLHWGLDFNPLIRLHYLHNMLQSSAIKRPISNNVVPKLAASSRLSHTSQFPGVSIRIGKPNSPLTARQIYWKSSL